MKNIKLKDIARILFVIIFSYLGFDFNNLSNPLADESFQIYCLDSEKKRMTFFLKHFLSPEHFWFL